MKRREMLRTGSAALVAASPLGELLKSATGDIRHTREIPLVHLTDLYHPPQDPDDLFDLATVAALEEYDLKGVILDVTKKFLSASPEGFDIKRDPGYIPVTQLAYLLGRPIPVAVGPTEPLASPQDDAGGRGLEEQSGIHLLLDILEESPRPVVVSVVGSARVLTAAFNRRPDLLRKKVLTVLLNAGATAGPKREWNVGLDPQAYIGLWRSGLPISWYPCATEAGAFNTDNEHGTYWKTSQSEILRTVVPSIRSWFAFALTKQTRVDFITALSDTPDSTQWDAILAGERNMWSTTSLVMGAGRCLARTPQGWRFVPSARATGEIWKWQLDPIDTSINDQAEVKWRSSGGETRASLFSRKKGSEFSPAMAEALSALLGELNGH
jgi:hypothetical protein